MDEVITRDAIEREKDFLKIQGKECGRDALDVKMLMHNHIAGILPLQLRYVDNYCQYCYALSGMPSLEEYLSGTHPGAGFLRQLCEDLLACSRICGEYFLEENHFLLQPPYIFRDMRTQAFWFCYCPEWTADWSGQVKELWETLLPVMDHQDKEAVSIGYGIYETVSAEGFRSAQLAGWLSAHTEGKGTGRRKQCDLRENQGGVREEEDAVRKSDASLDGNLLWEETGAEPQGYFAACEEKGEYPAKERTTVCGREFDRGAAEKPERAKMEGTEKEIPQKDVACKKEGRSHEKPGLQGAKTGETGAVYYLKNISRYPMLPEQIPLDQDMLTVGRAPDNDIIFPGGQISWQHARIEKEGMDIMVTDLGAANGVCINRKRLIQKHPVRCREGDKISFADITYCVCCRR